MLFPCCVRCALAYNHKEDEDDDDFLSIIKKPKRHNIRVENYVCPHTDEERGFVGTFTHIELLAALRNGYKVTKLLRSWHWEKWSCDLFRSYIRTFLKLKVEADWDESRPIEERDEVIRDYKKFYDIDLDPENMKRNEGMRYIAKLCLNSVRKFFKNYKKF